VLLYVGVIKHYYEANDDQPAVCANILLIPFSIHKAACANVYDTRFITEYVESLWNYIKKEVNIFIKVFRNFIAEFNRRINKPFRRLHNFPVLQNSY
jgi:hypothetical protein